MKTFKLGDKVKFSEDENTWTGKLDLIVKSSVAKEFDLAYILCEKPTGRDHRTGHVFYHKIGLYNELQRV